MVHRSKKRGEMSFLKEVSGYRMLGHKCNEDIKEEPGMPACQSALQPWVDLGLLYNQSPLLLHIVHHLILRIRFLLLEYSLPVNILFGIALSSILSTCPNHVILCGLIILLLSIMYLALRCTLSSTHYFPSQELGITHEINNSLELRGLQKRPAAQLVKNFPTFYGTRRFTSVFARAIRWSLS
jgi:hypothetical protein